MIHSNTEYKIHYYTDKNCWTLDFFLKATGFNCGLGYSLDIIVDQSRYILPEIRIYLRSFTELISLSFFNTPKR